MDAGTAGAAPLAGITAMLAIDALELSGGDTVLIVGATGGVGSFAVQLAARAGAAVVAPALPEDQDYLAYELAQAPAALDALATAHTQGKLAVRVS